jgi:hypothetical protein
MNPVVEFWTDVALRGIPILVAVFAGAVAWWNYRQKRDADKRSAWWERVRWALERANSDDEEESTLGWALLPEVMEDAGPEDEGLAAVVKEYVDSQALDQVELEGDQERGEDDGDGQWER